ncbi:MAG TPA: peptide ABC transporter substrate-binding protein [Dehalococcoidales bacterium]|nr:peptide ABC transporter substrate-binding protein [Dehalococcoidales bacterium]
MNKRTFIFSLIAIITVLTTILLPACKSSSSTTTSGSTTTSSSTTSSGSTTTSGSTTSSGSTTTSSSNKTTQTSTAINPKGPQEITLNLGLENNTIDPNRASWAGERSVILQCFDGLLAFDANLNLVPMVATDIPTVANGGISADGLTYTLKINPKVTWSDGKQVTANDFVFSIKREFDPNNAAEYASFYFDIVGGEAYYNSASKSAAEQTALKAAIGVKAIDDNTLQIKLISPLPTFIDLLALWPVYPLREDIITAHGDAWAQPDANGNMPYYIGDGPFLLQQWVQQDHYTFVPNPKYWGKKPYLTKITYKEITDANVAIAAYRNNELDYSGVPSGTEKATIADPILGKELVRAPQLVTFGLQFNCATAPFNNKTLRQALSCAIDRNAYVDQVRGGVGRATLSWIPPGMPDYDASLGTDWAFNPAKAKDLLGQAGYPNGAGLPALKFQYANTGVNPVMAQFIQAQLKTNLGINLTIEPMDSKAFSALVNNKQFSWALYGWGADYPDPDNWLPQIFGTGAGNNKTGYSSTAFDALSTQALKELDNTKRLQMWADAQKIVVQDAPMVFVFNREGFVVVKSWVKNFVPTGMDGQLVGDMFLRNVYIQFQ